ncbi:MAG: VPLPA-CTERM sorting domain-containing protein [Pseudomonadota bacterium]
MLTRAKTSICALALCLGATTAGAASLGLTTGDPTILADDTVLLFGFGDLIAGASVTSDSGGLGSLGEVFFSVNESFGGFSVDEVPFNEALASSTLLATGFTDGTAEFQFGGLTGTAAAQFGASALIEVTFLDDLGPRTSLFDGLVDDEFYGANISISSVQSTVIPLPATALLLATGLLGIGMLRRQRKTGGSVWTND